jgi:6-phosphofructokinase 1
LAIRFNFLINKYVSESQMGSIGIMTVGGDCPGLNAAIRGVVFRAAERQTSVVGFKYGFEGLSQDLSIDLNKENTWDILDTGGSILGCSGDNPFRDDPPAADAAVATFERHGLDALIVIGGNSSMGTALLAEERGIPVVGIPKTIDNDVEGTDVTIGFDTAVETAADAIGRLRTTAESHGRVMIVETMGRDFGWIAVAGGIAGGADIVLTPEEPVDVEAVAQVVRSRKDHGQEFTIIVIGEGATFKGEDIQYGNQKPGDKYMHLSGVGAALADRLEALEPTRWKLTVSVIGHLQRGGPPSATDRILASRFGVRAVDEALDGGHGNMVAVRNGQFTTTPLVDVAGKLKAVDKDLLKDAHTFNARA